MGWLTVSPLTRRRWRNFRANRRGYISLWIFLALFALSLCAESLANEKPLLISYDGGTYVPVLVSYPETTFGGDFPTEADYTDPFVQELIAEKGWILWPPVRFSCDTIIRDLGRPAPAPPSARNWLGTDDQARDVLARVIYGFRISVTFGLLLTLFSSLIGVFAGAVQGFYGGWIDLGFQRFLEIWGGLPALPADHPGRLFSCRVFGCCSASCCCSVGPPSPGWCAPNSCGRAISTMCGRRGRSASRTRP